MRHILDLSEDEKIKFLDSFDLVLSDCNGVLWTIMSPILGSGDAINLLEACGKRIAYISNNSMKTDKEYQEKLKQIGVNVTKSEDIIHPVKTIIKYLKKIRFQGLVYAIAHQVFINTLRDAGYEVLESGNEVYRSQEELAEKLSTEECVQAVILDIDININFAKLIRAQQYLKNPDCLFILGASDKLMPLKNDLNILGPVGFSNMLKEVSGKEPIVMGKPGNMLGSFLVEHFHIEDPNRVLFIGATLAQDIAFGKSCRFQTMAVLSGATNKEQLLSYFYENRSPDYYADSLSDFKEFFNNFDISEAIVRENIK